MRLGIPVVAAAILLTGAACSAGSEVDGAATTAATVSLTEPTAVATTTPVASTTTPAPTTSLAPASSSTTAAPAAPVIGRPFVDPSICTPVSTREVEAGSYLARPFALGTTEPLPVQAFADPALRAAGPFAVVLRIPMSRIPQGREPNTTVNGVPVYVGVYPNGNGDASWALPDGTFGYLRARDLDEATIIDALSRLSPRPADAAIPGFDVAPATQPGSLAFVAEHLTSDLLGDGSSLTCEVGDHSFWVSAVRGEPVAQYLSVIDSPRPLAVAPNGDGVLVIHGPPMAPGAPTIADVREADTDEWTALLDADSG